MRTLIFILALVPALAFAEASSDNTQVLIAITANYHYSTGNLADQVAGAAYTKKFANPVAAELALGFLSEPFYIGLSYDYWFAQRKFTLGGAETSDTLRYHAAGLEVGYASKNPRVIFLVLGGVFYPIERKASGPGGLPYEATDTRLGYRVRGQVGIRFNRSIALLMGGGYRFSQLGNLNANGASFLPGGASLDLSGPFLNAGLGFSF